MGSPELPENHTNHENNLHAPSGVLTTTAATVTSDDSDNDAAAAAAQQGTPYDGYQQLSGMDFNEPDDDDDDSDEDSEAESNGEPRPSSSSSTNQQPPLSPDQQNSQITKDHDENPVTEEDNSTNGIPNVQSADAEVEGMVWNAPRPQELTIELDENRTEQIMSAMSRISLPQVAIPEWAQGIPEEKWKEDLLLRIRQRQT